MTRQHTANRNAQQRPLFPVGIFFLLFLIESIVGAGALLAYFYYEARSGTVAIESSVRFCAVHLAEALAGLAEVSSRTKRYDRLRAAFVEQKAHGTIGEAFFVLHDGRIIAHSQPECERRLKGNIASDEFTYNLDLILKPVRDATKETLFSDYNIPEKRVPYHGAWLEIAKRYLYRSIDSSGWIASRAVFQGKKPIGAVCFIIGKDRVYAFLESLLARCRLFLWFVLGGSCAISLIVTLVVFSRYRYLYRRALALTEPTQEDVSPAADHLSPEPLMVEMIDMTEGLSAVTPFDGKRPVKEAVPVRGRE